MVTMRYFKDVKYMNELDVIGSILDKNIIYYGQRELPQCEFLNPNEIGLFPTLHFPKVSEKPEKRMVQDGNYEYFINVMADMIQKYIPEIERKVELK